MFFWGNERKYFTPIPGLSVESPTSAGILTNKDKRIFFYDGLSTVGAHYALFTGMSLLSFAEIVILILEILYNLLKLLNPKKWQNNPESENMDSKMKMCQLEHGLKASNTFLLQLTFFKGQLISKCPFGV